MGKHHSSHRKRRSNRRNKSKDRKRKTHTKRGTNRKTKRKTKRRTRKQKGGNAEKLGRTSDNIRTLQRNNTEKCQTSTTRQIEKCDTLISGRKECRKDAQDIRQGIKTLTDAYTKDMDEIIKQCGDKHMSESELKKCESKLAQTSQEYVAQCLNFATGIEFKYGSKTLESKKAAAMGYVKKITDILPGQKSKREKAELEKAMKDLINQWIRNCENNPSLEKATGMESYSFSCRDVRGKKTDQEIEPFIKELMRKVK